MNSPISIILAADDNFAQHLGVTLCSLFENRFPETKIDIYVIDGGLSQENKSKLLLLADKYRFQIQFLSIDKKMYANFTITRHITHTMYYRISIPDLLPKNLERVLYLDCDIVVTQDLSELWNTDLEEKIIGAVNDGMRREKIEPVSSTLGIPNPRYYFNSGVLLINLRMWKKFDITKKVLEFITNNPELIKQCPDQDALNAILWDKRHELSVAYNYQRTNTKNNILINPAIIHYTGKNKPWIYMSKRHLHDEKYFNYIKLTPWKDFRPSDKNLSNILRKHFGFLNKFKILMKKTFPKSYGFAKSKYTKLKNAR